jgi:hypothetical protein
MGGGVVEWRLIVVEEVGTTEHKDSSFGSGMELSESE